MFRSSLDTSIKPILCPRKSGPTQNWIIEEMNERGAQIVISQHPRRIQPLKIDRELYKWRHLIENFFGKLKEFKGIAMRACKTDTSFEAMIYVCSGIINSR